MPRKAARLPNRFPVGTKYILESRGGVKGMTLIHRYVQFPNGRQVELAARLIEPCGAANTTTATTATAAKATATATAKPSTARVRRSRPRSRSSLVPTA
jgi:hypothetical protein